MPYRYLTDSAGESIKCLDVDGILLAPAPKPTHEAEIRTLQNWKSRPNDIIICAYPRSGTHWTWEIVSMLVNGNAERIPFMKEQFNMEFLSEDTMESFSSTRVLNTHLYLHQLPIEMIKNKCRIIFVDRNPKDVAVSFYHHHLKAATYEYEGKWENYVYRFLNGLVDFGSWFDYALDWEKVITNRQDLPIHVLHYEDMKEEVTRLSQFLGMKETEDTSFLCKSITSMCGFNVMKKEKDPIEACAPYWRDLPGNYRKGTHWTWEIVSMLMNGKAEHIPCKKDTFNLEFLSEDQMDSFPSPRVLNSHLQLQQLPTDIIDKNSSKSKDVAVSFYHLHLKIFPYEYKGKWENYVYRFLNGLVDFGSWFDYTLNWEKEIASRKDLPIHIVNYEDMKENPMREVTRLSKFLGIEQTEETLALCKNVTKMCEFEAMKAEKDPIEAVANYWSNGPGNYRKGT
ncbi:hypothetical protein KUTeg_013963 [Tegillarca granosa]|uniref:Sulfotransferase domain-containing protein n=1 Tax=Tegillarca granosa TaxID=220873 RepID=A0ABQ9EVJ8_TEGGR|nr:hypothetical protein KUTeg_013963 [Tegillarca granosa]